MTPIETTIATRLIGDLLAAGYRVGVNDGEDTVLRWSDDCTAILKAMGTTCEDYLLVNEVVAQGGGQSYRQIGWVLLIWGNGIDLISDHTTNLTEVVDPILDWLTATEVAVTNDILDATIAKVEEALNAEGV